MSEPRDDKITTEDTQKWGRRIEFGIVFLVTGLVVLALAFFVLGEWRDHAFAIWGALALAGIAGLAAARTPKVRSALIDVLKFLQNISQLWR